MSTGNTFDCAITGGGLAGLALAIQLNRSGLSTVLFEKETYPFHKVCGEYIAMESWDFIERLGVPLSTLSLPRIDHLTVSAPGGRSLTHNLKPGGFGISRFMLDRMLAEIARAEGVTLLERTKVEAFSGANGGWLIKTPGGDFQSRMVFGSYGKRANLDVKLKRSFIRPGNRKLNDFIAVKYHVKADLPANRIGLHLFNQGYCGISKVEGERYCLCYLTRAENLAAAGSDLSSMEREVLYKNPYLKDYFTRFISLYEEPLVISQVSFAKKTTFENGMLMLGDAAGLITPLCGNGMSMALHASKILAELVPHYFNGTISEEKLVRHYAQTWRKTFEGRLRAGRFIQSLFGDPLLSTLSISLLKPFPFAVNRLVSLTHGQPF